MIRALYESGELVANLSASDLRRLDEHTFRLLALPVAEFISRRKGDAIGRRGAPFAEAGGTRSSFFPFHSIP